MPGRVLVAGYYGFGNAGDEGILDAVIQNLVPTGAEVIALSGNPKGTLALHGVPAVSWLDTPSVAKTVKISDTVILSGGVFHDYLGLNLGRILGWDWMRFESILSVGLLARLHGKQLVIAGAGVGPLRTDLARELTRQVFEASTFAVVRDKESKALLRALGVESERLSLGADLAFLPSRALGEHGIIGNVADAAAPQAKERVSIILRNWIFGDSRICWMAELAQGILQTYRGSGVAMECIPMQVSSSDGIDDTMVLREFADALAPDLQVAVPARALTHDEAVRRIRGSSLVLSMRYHGIVYAAQAGVPVVAVSPDPKLVNLMTDLGLHDYCLPLEGLSGPALAWKLRKAVEDREAIRHTLVAGCRRLSARCARSIVKVQKEMAWVPGLSPQANDQTASEGLTESLTDATTAIGASGLETNTESLEDLRAELIQAIYKSRKRRSARKPGRGGAQAKMALEVTEPSRSFLDERALARLLAHHARSSGVVVFAPTVDWGFMLQRPQQMARALAEEGYLSLYCTSNQQADDVSGFRRIGERVYLCDLGPRALQAIPRPILVLGSPWHRPWLEYFDEALIVYDICDDIRVSGGTMADHMELLARADIVATSSMALFNNAMINRPDALLLPNAVDPRVIRNARSHTVKRFARSNRTSPNGGRLSLGYMGALAEWVDYDLIAMAASSYPECDIVLLGADYDGSIWRTNLLELGNVSWLGALEHLDALERVLGFSVAMIPFRVNEITKSASPIKLFEYMACGKPTVTTALPECEGYEGVFVAKSPEQFMSSIERALAARTDPVIGRALRRNASRNTWSSRAKALAKRVGVELKDERIGQGAFPGSLTGSLPVTLSFGESIGVIRAARDRLRVAHGRLSGVEETYRTAEVEIALARAKIANLESATSRHQAQLAESRAEIERMWGVNASESARAAEAVRQLASLRATAGVRLLDGYWRVMRRIAPEGSSIRALYMRARGGLSEGLRASSGIFRGNRRSSISIAGGRWPAGRRGHAPGDEVWLRALDEFLGQETDGGAHGTVVFLAPTRFEASEGQRSYHLAQDFARRGWQVIFGFWRWGIDDERPRAGNLAGVFDLPLDVLLVDPDRALRPVAAGTGLVFVEFPVSAAFRFLASANARGYVTIYDAVDDWHAFQAAGQALWYEAGFESSLGASCDTILAVSPGLATIVGQRCNREVHLVPNGWSPDLLQTSTPVTIERGTITLGYFGHLTDAWFDWDLLTECARRQPDWRIHLIGYGGGWRTTRLPENVTYIGKLPRSALAAYAAGWDVAIIPFRSGEVAAAADPIKTYEYLAFDLPVVGTGVCPPVGAEDLVRIAGDAGSFVRDVATAAASRRQQTGERQEFATANTWDRRVDAILRILETDEPRVAFKRRVFEAAA